MNRILFSCCCFLVSSISSANCSPEKILSAASGRWVNEARGASLEATFSGPTKPWSLFFGKVRIDTPQKDRNFDFTVIKNVSQFTKTVNYSLRMQLIENGAKAETKIFTLTNCLAGDQKIIFTRLFDRTDGAISTTLTEYLILGGANGPDHKLLVGFESGDLYCNQVNTETRQCGTGYFEPYLLHK